MKNGLLIISPVRNEADHIELIARALAGQTRRPDLWLVVDDNSTDATPELLARLERELPFMRVLATPPGYTRDHGDRHAVAAAPRAFNWALAQVAGDEFDFIGKLDGDIELPPDYFELLLREFAADPELGIAGGTLVERDGADWKPARVPAHHVRGALKLYRRECLQAIGGVQERLGWDGIDGNYARLRGYRTHSFEHVVARHHRPVGTADGRLRGRMRGGETHYIVGFGPAWVLAKSVKVARTRPYGVSGAAFLAGYLRAALGSVPRVEDEEYRRFVRCELRGRIFGRKLASATPVESVGGPGR